MVTLMFPMSIVTRISPPVMVMMLNTISSHSVVLSRFPNVLMNSR
jgi:hypothetical protein